MSTPDTEQEMTHLVKMANQIAENIGVGVSSDIAVDKVRNHIRMFWARPMKEKICAELESHSTELLPVAAEALQDIKTEL